MTKFTDNLWSDLTREHGPTLAHADRPEPGRAGPKRILRRPRILASSTLGLAGVGAALVLILGGSTAAPAFAITKEGDGSVLVKLDYAKDQNLPQVNAKLAAMGTGEQITIYMASGPASVSGPVTCTPTSGASGPSVKVLDGTNGTEVIAPGESAGNTAGGTFHLDHCTVAPARATGPGTGNSGNTGAG
jgi:hypothetical protein